MNKLLVVSKFNEDVSWTKDVHVPTLIVDKSLNPINGAISRPNIGREAETMAWFIVENYHALPDIIIFVQGDPRSEVFSYEECINKINTENFNQLNSFLSREDKIIHVDNFWLKKFPSLYNKIFQDGKKEIKFCLGAQYVVPRENILSKPLSFYKKIHEEILKFGNRELNADSIDLNSGIDAWSMEGLWYEIFDKDTKINPSFEQDFKLGLFYQSGYRLEACYFALNQFRKFYPKAPVALYEDNTNILKPISRKFNCSYATTDKQGFNDAVSGRPAFNLETILAWIDRVYEACTTTLSGVDFVMNFEDDVWFKAPLKSYPPYDLSGISGVSAHRSYYEYFEAKKHSTYGCGGSLFNRKKFLIAYEKSKSIDWDLVDKLAVGFKKENKYPKPSMWTDSALTLLFINAEMSTGHWSELDAYFNPKGTGHSDRSNWFGPIEELEKEQKPGVNVIHCWKPYYFPTQDEIDFVKKDLNRYALPSFI